MCPADRAAADGKIHPGVRIDRYEILSAIGAGGMGEVWRARDTTLGRDVAIKALPPALAGDADRMLRLQREAQILAGLNHPNIAVIHGLETWGPTVVLVLEFVEGLTLADRLYRGALPVDEALGVALQLAETIEAAHGKGIVHRDLKAANMMLTVDGRLKVLDFGIAKSIDAGADLGAQHSTLTVEKTAVSGTPAYMAPEQARGEPVTPQVDIWAFGVVLYQMLTGVEPFRAATAVDVLAKILNSDVDYARLPPGTPPAVMQLLRRCLEKKPKNRLHHMGDVRIALEDARVVPQGDVRNVPRAPARLLPVVAATAIVLALGAAGWTISQRRPAVSDLPSMAFSIPFGEPPWRGPIPSRSIAIANDGLTIAFTSQNRLWIRRVDQKDAIAVPGSGGASNPFFSPDGAWVGFRGGASGWMKVRVGGGTPQLIASSNDRSSGAAWGADDTIVFGTTEGLYRVAASGGQPTLIVKPDPQKNERLYGWPVVLPGDRLLYTVAFQGSGQPRIVLLNLKTLESRTIVDNGMAPAVLQAGQLLYASGPSLEVVTFDPASGETSGNAVTLPDIDVHSAGDAGAADFAISQTGTLIYLPSDAVADGVRTYSWIDREGREQPLPIKPERSLPRISPDGSLVALDRISSSGRDVWILNLARLSVTQLTDGPSEDILPIWSPDGRRVFFASDRSGQFDIYSQSPDGAGEPRLEVSAPGVQMPVAITPDGTTLLVLENLKNIVLVPLAEPRQPRPLLHADSNQRLPSVSPDGHWVVYESNESGNRYEIFVRPFPDTSRGREQVSIDGGRFPQWLQTPDHGLEIVYLTEDGAMMAAPVSLTPRLSIGRPTRLFQWVKQGSGARPYDVSPVDGRFLMARPVDTGGKAATNLSVVLNALATLSPAPRRP